MWAAQKGTVLLHLPQSLGPQRAILKLEGHSRTKCPTMCDHSRLTHVASAEGTMNTGPGLAFGVYDLGAGSSRITDSRKFASSSGSPEHHINYCGFFRFISPSPPNPIR